MKNLLKFLALIVLVVSYTSCDDVPVEPSEIESSAAATGATGPTGPALDPYKDWMKILLMDNLDRAVTLKDICMPRAHDAGMWKLTTCGIGANECNTQTQDLSMEQLLRRGTRKFDIRPVSAGGIYFTQHKTACDGLGCRGDRIQNILNETKSFVDCHSELVILEFGSFCNTSAEDQDLIDMVNNTLQDRLYTEASTSVFSMNDVDLHTIIPSDELKGKVIILYSGVANAQFNRIQGIFAKSYISQLGSYANSFQVDVMKADQLAKYNSFDHSSNNTFMISWTLTLNTDLSVQCANPFSNTPGIEGYAYQAHEELTPTIDSLIGIGSIAQGQIPNVISVDFNDFYITDECIKISELNLE